MIERQALGRRLFPSRLRMQQRMRVRTVMLHTAQARVRAKEGLLMRACEAVIHQRRSGFEVKCHPLQYEHR